MSDKPRLAVDIGGTFTDIALDVPGGSAPATLKVLTTPASPEDAVLEGVTQVVGAAGIEPGDVGLIIHGTTLATNLLIERRGARTALVVTAGHRDALEMAQENRFEQYDIGVDRPQPLVPPFLRLPVRERVDKDGEVLLPLEEQDVESLLPVLRRHDVQSVAVGLIHGYANPAHELRIGELISHALPDLSVTLASSVCPEIREYERLSTACANAYVQPLMQGYLRNLEQRLEDRGFCCPLLLMTSGGGMVDVETAVTSPIRLVESGPAGGAILASHIARIYDVDGVISFDMGGTTAKLCLIDDGEPLQARDFEVDRSYRFKKGSGLPVRIPVIEMVEIGAGGGSLVSVDSLGRVQVGPQSAGSSPGPAAYGAGGDRATVTDADVVLGRIDAERFAGGRLRLDVDAAERAVTSDLAELSEPREQVDLLEGQLDSRVNSADAAFMISEVVDENMSNAARTHAVERGKDVRRRTLVAFGGAAPLHAARLAEKLGLERIVVPRGAGVGSALGFLLAPVAYEVVRSRYVRLSEFDGAAVSQVFDEMRHEAAAVVALAVSPSETLKEKRQAFMRYVGQGNEVAVELDASGDGLLDPLELHDRFEQSYRGLFGRTIPGLDVEVLSWTLSLSTTAAPVERVELDATSNELRRESSPSPEDSVARRLLYDSSSKRMIEASCLRRDELDGVCEAVRGPALITEDQTTTVLPVGFVAYLTPPGDLVLERRAG